MEEKFLELRSARSLGEKSWKRTPEHSEVSRIACSAAALSCRAARPAGI
jgi:hypothetical protein